MRHGMLTLCLFGSLAAGSVRADPATQPSTTLNDLEMRGVQELNRENYTGALPILRKVAADLQGQPDRLSSIQEDIRVCERNIATQKSRATQVAFVSADSSPGVPVQAAAPSTPATQPVASADTKGLLPGGLGGTMRTPHPKPTPGVAQEMAIKDLGNFDYDPEKGGNIPADVLAMDSSTIRLRGYMIPMDQAESITRFAPRPQLVQLLLWPAAATSAHDCCQYSEGKSGKLFSG